MKKVVEERAAFIVVGKTIRTNNKIEAQAEQSRIFPVIQRFVHDKTAERIPHRIEPGTLICGYTEYESDHTGDYTYFIGEKVSGLNGVPADLEVIQIPAQRYVKFTNGPAAMPEVIREAWFKIWQMKDVELSGSRAYVTDFEVYDERAKDHSAIVLDICIGLKS